MYETPSLHMFGYSSEQLKLREYQELKDMIKSQEKLAQITHSKLKEDLQRDFENDIENQVEEKILDAVAIAKAHQTLDPQEIQDVLLNTKLMNDIYSQFSDLSKTINKLEQNMKKSFAEQRIALVNEVLNLIHNNSFEMLTVRNLKFMSQVGQAGMILNEDEVNNILNSLDQNKITITNNIIQLLYDKGLFDSFPNKDQAFANYLTFSESYLKEKYGKTIPTSNGEYYLSDLGYSTRQSILKSLKKSSYKDLVDMKHRMKLTPTEINFILYDGTKTLSLPDPNGFSPAPYDVESRINKRLQSELQKVNSFNNSIQNISLMMKYYEMEEKKYKQKYNKYKLINNLINSLDGIIVIGTTSASISLSITGVGIIVVPITAGVGCATGILVKLCSSYLSKIINLSTLLFRRLLTTLDNFKSLA